MEDTRIKSETAKLAKEKGFDWKVRFSYGKKNEVSKESLNGYEDDNFNFYKGTYWQISAPTQSLLQKWLREKHGINISIVYDYDGQLKIFYSYNISSIKQGFYTTGCNLCSTYEEALESALLEALKLINK